MGKSSCSKGFGDFNYCDFVNFCRTFCKKALAFTLAETLVVMGIIGVVAALTLPNLNNSTGDKEKIVKFRKIFQNLEDAFGRARSVYGPIATWTKAGNINGAPTDALSGQSVGDRLTEFIKVQKNVELQLIQVAFLLPHLII